MAADPAPSARPKLSRYRGTVPGSTNLKRFRTLGVLEKARLAKQWREEDRAMFSDIGRVLGVSYQTVRDWCAILNEAAPAVLEAVDKGRLTPTTAVHLIRACPEKGKQADYLHLASIAAEASHQRFITAKHFPVPLGKDRNQPDAAPVAALRRVLQQMPGANNDTERRKTARAVLRFLTGGHDAAALRSFLTDPKK